MKPKQSFLHRVRSLLGLDQGEDSESILHTLSRAIEAKDPHTLGHADRVSQYAVELGRCLGVNNADLNTLHKGGLLHDIGKIAIPDAILLKPGKYTDEEFTTMKQHPVLGCEICQKLRSVQDALPIIRHHHERLDGSGYPDGLKGNAVSPLVRIVTIVDIYDALRSRRTYKEAFSLDTSFKIMWEEAEKGWWDKDVLAHWEKLIRSKNA
jgi:putative two-component system response regulator